MTNQVLSPLVVKIGVDSVRGRLHICVQRTMMNAEAQTDDGLGPYVHAALHKLGVNPVARTLDLSREAAMGIALGIASKGSLAVARANLAKLRQAMGDV